MSQIELENLAFAYPEKSFELSVDHQVLSDSMIAIVGQNGAGKSTIFKLLTGLLKAQSGKLVSMGWNSASWIRNTDCKKLALLFKTLMTNCSMQLLNER